MEELFVVADNKFKNMVAEYFLDLKMHMHYKSKHNMSYLKITGIFRRFMFIFAVVCLLVMLVPLKILCYPFVWIDENILN